ncbi:hypothetical protein WMF20_48565 [Sorangium sp. So ce834]|uniref:hypothetical protein n=1 Tax=Sorangium sp. So ce834 TaxID=3133321 RepID=UPI003F62D458
MESISPKPVLNEVETAAPPRRILVVDDNLKIHEDFAKILGGRREASALDAAEEALFGAPEPRERPTSFHLDCAHRAGADGLAADPRQGPGREVTGCAQCRGSDVPPEPPVDDERATRPRSRGGLRRFPLR